MIPPGMLFALGLLSADRRGGARFSQNGHFPEKGALLNISESFAFNVFPSQQATFTPLFPGGPPRTAIRLDPDSYGDFALPWDPVHMKVCVCLSRMESLALDLASFLSSGEGYLFESFRSICLKIAQYLVVNFVVFRREVELQSFYSTILILFPVVLLIYLT